MEEYITSAKIIQEQRAENRNLWRYTFVNLQTNQEDYFLNNCRINYIPSLSGRLKLLIGNDRQYKLFQWFNQDFINTSEELQKLKTLTRLEGKLEKGVKEIDIKRRNLKPTPEQIGWLRKKGHSWQEIRDFFGVSEWTIRRRKKSIYRPKQKTGRKLKINDENILSRLYSYIHSHNKLLTPPNQQEVANYLYQQTGKLVSQPTISRMLKRHNLTHKKITYHYSEQIPRLTDIKSFIKMIGILPQQYILAVDECSFHFNEAPRYGYGWKGQRVIAYRPGNRGSNHTLILCIQNIKKQGVIHYELIEGAVNAQIFNDFLLGINFTTNAKYYLLLDNVPIHRSVKTCRKLGIPTVKELLNQKNIEPIFLVPYSPQLNPVELLFNIIRQSVEKDRPRNFQELKKAIDKIINILNQKDLTKFFQHSMNYEFSEENGH